MNQYVLAAQKFRNILHSSEQRKHFSPKIISIRYI